MKNKRHQELIQYEQILEKHEEIIKRWNVNSKKLNQIVRLIDNQHFITLDEK